METIQSIDIYKSLCQPPAWALREISSGRLKGKTDINPQWRYEAMTKQFGLVGFGWKYDPPRLWTEQGANGEVLAFAEIRVYVFVNDKWSEAIIGVGGSKLVTLEKERGLVSNDDGFKMAVTDAFSTAMKMLGVGGDVYAGMWDGGDSKYQKKTGQMKGDEATPEERKELEELFGTKIDGKPVFSREDKQRLSAMRETLTMKEVISMARSYIVTFGKKAKGRAIQIPENEMKEVLAKDKAETDQEKLEELEAFGG